MPKRPRSSLVARRSEYQTPILLWFLLSTSLQLATTESFPVTPRITNTGVRHNLCPSPVRHRHTSSTATFLWRPWRRRTMEPPPTTRMPDEEDEFCEVTDDTGCVAYEARTVDDTDVDKNRWIRLEKEVDPCLQKDGSLVLTREQIVAQMHQVSATLAELGPADLYPRRWIPTSSASSVSSDDQDLQVNGNTKEHHEFTVLQFNMLAEGLSSLVAKAPFRQANGDSMSNGESGKQNYGGFTAISFPDTVLDFSLRRWRLLEVLLGRDGEAPNDVMALEEVDRFAGFFRPILSLFGYKGIFVPKPRSPGVGMGWYSDGCALFWKTDKFAQVDNRRGNYQVGNQVWLAVALQHLSTGQIIVAAVTHLKAQKSEANELIRSRQVDELLEQISAFQDDLRQRFPNKKKIPSMPVLLMGDFNADPPADVDGPESCIARVIQSTEANSKDAPKYSSVYPIDPPTPGFYTTWKIRGTKTSKRVIDYIFHSNNLLQCQATLSVPDVEELEPTKLPGLRYPSDHLAIGAKFRLER